MVRLVVGLGNPGRTYDRTRHNVGFWVVDRLADLQDASWRKSRTMASLLAEGDFAGSGVLFAKPQTYMNRSGVAIRRLADVHGLRPEQILVVHDDLDLPEKSIRIRRSGSAGGHRGVASIIEHLGSQYFGRLRIGIGRPPVGVTAADFVLLPMTPAERDDWQAVVVQACEAVHTILAEGYERAMNRFHAR